MGAVADQLEKEEFRNSSKGYVGAIIIDPDGRRRGIAVPPGETVWLSEDEQILTANAPKREEDNPFGNGTFEIVTESGGIRDRRVIGNQRGPKPPLAASPQEIMGESREETPIPEEVGAAPAPEGEPAEGEYAPGEEVATPEAARRPVTTPPPPQGQEAAMVPAPPARDPQPQRRPPRQQRG